MDLETCVKENKATFNPISACKAHSKPIKIANLNRPDCTRYDIFTLKVFISKCLLPMPKLKVLSSKNVNQKNFLSYISCNQEIIKLIECGLDDEGNTLLFNPISQTCDKNYQCLNITHKDLTEMCSNFGPGKHNLITDISCKR